MLKDIPNSRDIWTVIGQAPGFMVTSFDVGGSRAGTQTGYSAFGYSGQVRVQVDGVNTTEGTGGAGSITTTAPSRNCSSPATARTRRPRRRACS